VYRALGRRLVHRVQPPSAILTGGAVLRVAGGVFYGLGDPPSEDPAMAKAADEEKSETDSGKQRTPLTIFIPPAILVAAAFAIGLFTPLGPAVEAAASRFEDQPGYNATVLAAAHLTYPVAMAAAESTGITVASVLAGVDSAVGAVILAFSPCTGAACRCCAAATSRAPA
jgi:multicomponent Na+:H+ antiporter subunit D